MYEIELKAHVADRKKTSCIIDSFAEFSGTTFKTDFYYHLNTKDGNGVHGSKQIQLAEIPYITCRLREEKTSLPDGTNETHNLFTYKTKERKTADDGTVYECNIENETSLSNPDAVKKILLDSGYELSYTKTKDVRAWTYSTKFGNANLELCTIELLGDFLEIEIVTESAGNEKQIYAELQDLILKSGLSLSDIEPRYYSELLREAKNTKQ